MNTSTSDSSIEDLGRIATKLRRDIISTSAEAKTAHIGSCLSCVDMLATLYWRFLNITSDNVATVSRDQFILSKGHAALALYATLHHRNLIDNETYATYALPGAKLPEHPSPNCAPGIDAASGSLGHGLSVASGLALAKKIKKQSHKVVAMLSDGECNEGSVWEAAMLAPTLNLNNLIAIVDFNGWQATGRSREITSLESLEEKWRAFGWEVYSIDGHNIGQCIDALDTCWSNANKPSVIVAHTIKGKGVSFMEDDNNWHYRIPNKTELENALKELTL